MDQNPKPPRIGITQIYSFPGFVFLLVILGFCYVIQGGYFTALLGCGVLIGLTAATIGAFAKRTNGFQFSIRGLLVVITVVAMLAIWQKHFLINSELALERIKLLGGDAQVVEIRTGQKEASASFIQLKIAPGHLNYLRSLPNLVKLDLDYTQVGDRGMSYVGKLTELEWLDIEDTGISNDGLRRLGALQKLRNLIVDGNDVSDEGLMHLSKLNSLESVRMLNTQVTEEGIEKFNQALPNCQVIIGPIKVR